jgi:hypothetical protein
VQHQHGQPVKNKFITIGKNRSQGLYCRDAGSFIIKPATNGQPAPKIAMQVAGIAS